MCLVCGEALYDVFLNLLDYAARAASITCSRRGADLPFRKEL